MDVQYEMNQLLVHMIQVVDIPQPTHSGEVESTVNPTLTAVPSQVPSPHFPIMINYQEVGENCDSIINERIRRQP